MAAHQKKISTRHETAKRTARVFRNGRNQAVRIPVDWSFETDRITLERSGDALILRPEKQDGWEAFFADPSLVLPEDFEIAEDPPPQERSWP